MHMQLNVSAAGQAWSAAYMKTVWKACMDRIRKSLLGKGMQGPYFTKTRWYHHVE